MPLKFRELSFLDQLRVCRFLTRGEAPNDPHLAAITLEAGERYQTQSQVLAVLFRWWPVVLALSLMLPILRGVIDGQMEMMVLFLLIVLGLVANIILNPWTRPKRVRKSMEASRRIEEQAASRETDGSAVVKLET